MPVDLSNLPPNLHAAALKIAERIDFESVVDKGSNGYVLVGQNKLLSRKVVVKFYYWGDGAHMEPRLLETLSAPNVLKVDDASSIDDDYAYFITPFCEKGDLDNVISSGFIDLKKVVDMIIDVSTGAGFIHSKGYIHRDLKPSNVFCAKNGKIIIGDFGSVVAKGKDGYAKTSSKHSLLYRTPEEIATDRAYTQGDVYQIGIILYQLLGGHLPYLERDWLSPKELECYENLPHPEDQIYATSIIEQRITKGRLLDLSSLPPWCPRELTALIKKCCKTTLSDRMDSPSTLIAKLHNLRASLPDWRFEPDPVLYRGNVKIRLVRSGTQFTLEKMAQRGSTWRRIRSVEPCSLRRAVTAALA